MKVVEKNFFGIDFGTTNTAAVGRILVNHEIIKHNYGDWEGLPIPSVIAIDKKTGTIYTGRDAWEKKVALSESCEYISSVKTLLGDENWQRIIHGEIWTPVIVAAEMFCAIKREVIDLDKTEIQKATLAIPIGFSPLKREKLREAANLAGITITSFISEPTAAFFANYDELKSATNVAVFDWGGGTLDVSVLKNENGKVFELATKGLPEAGDAIDSLIAHRIHQMIAREKRKEIAYEDMGSAAQDLLRVKSEQAKRALGEENSTVISMNKYGEYGTCKAVLNYDWFVDIVTPTIDRAVKCFNTAIEESGVGLANIDRILLVGGSSNLRPLVERMAKEFGENKIYRPETTMWNVGEGAALLAQKPGIYRSNQSIGIVLSDGSYFELLGKDEPLQDWKKTVNFGVVDVKEEARFVFDGSDDIKKLPDRNRVLKVPGYKFLQEQILLTAKVTEDSVFEVQGLSDMHMTEPSKLWEYPNLKCYYELPKV